MKLISILFIIAIGGLLLFTFDAWPLKHNKEQNVYQAGNRHFEDGNYQQASEKFKSIVDNDPANVDALRGLARSYTLLGKYHDALALYNRAIAQAPEFAATYANRGILHDRMQHYPLAIQDYRHALKLQPDLAKGPGWLTRFLRNQAERPPSILDRLDYLEKELQKPAQERLLILPDKDRQQRPYKIDAD